MKFWQENRNIILFLGLAAGLFAVLRPWPLFPWPFSDPRAPVLSWPYGQEATLKKAWVDRLNGQLKDFYPKEELEPRYDSPLHDLYLEVLSLLGADISGLIEEHKKTVLPSGTQPLSQVQGNLTDRENELREDFNGLQSLMAHVIYPPYRVPRWEEEPGFYFIRTLRSADKELEAIRQLLDETKSGNPTYDKTLGFNIEIPPTPARTPFLLIQLGMIRDVLELALRSGVTRVSRVGPAQDFEQKGSPEEVFFSEYPISFGMAGSLPSLLQFLSALNGVHGEITMDPADGACFMNRGSKHGLRQGERLILSRANEFVCVATVAEAQETRARLVPEEVSDGQKHLEPAAGDHADSHFYKVRTLELRPSQDPRFENHLEMTLELAAIRFEQEAIEGEKPTVAARSGGRGPGLMRTGISSSSSGGPRPPKPKPTKGESRYNYRY